MLNLAPLFTAQIADLTRAVADAQAAKAAPPVEPDPRQKKHGGARAGAGRKMRADRADSRKRVIAALREHQPAGPQLLADVTGMHKSVVRKHLLDMVAEGQVRRLEDSLARYAPYVLARRP